MRATLVASAIIFIVASLLGVSLGAFDYAPALVESHAVLTAIENTFTAAFGNPSSWLTVASGSAVVAVEPLCVSVAQGARMLSISRAKMYELIREGHFTLIKIAGTKSAIDVADIKRYHAKRKAASKEVTAQKPEGATRAHSGPALAASSPIAAPEQHHIAEPAE